MLFRSATDQYDIVFNKPASNSDLLEVVEAAMSGTELNIQGQGYKIASRDSDVRLTLTNQSAAADAGSSYRLDMAAYWLTASGKPFIQYDDDGNPILNAQQDPVPLTDGDGQARLATYGDRVLDGAGNAVYFAAG